MAIIVKNITQNFNMWQTHIKEQIRLSFYGTIAAADVYFNVRLNAIAWRQATYDDKISALTEATQIIDLLNYQGEKIEGNVHEFPRVGEEMPLDIEYATYEIALKILMGVDFDRQAGEMMVTGRTYQSIKTTYARGSVPEYWFVLSARAWYLLKPYLADIHTLNMMRMS